MASTQVSDVADQSPVRRPVSNMGDTSSHLRTGATGIGRQARRITGVVLLAVFILIFSLWIPNTFLTHTTFQNIVGGQAITIILAVGILFPLAAGQYDLSAAQNLGFAAVLDAALMVHAHMSPVPAAALTLAAGLAVGLVNGILVVRFAINSFIATLGMSSVLLALTELLSNNQFLGPLSTGFQSITQHSPLGIPIIALYAIGIAVIVWYLLEHTPLGRRIYATGASAPAARLAGVRTERMVIGVFVASGVLAALSGILLAANVGEVSPTAGPSYLLPGFAACFLGTTQFKLGRFNVWGTVLALFLLGTGVTGLELAGGQSWITDMFNGVALIGAVGIAMSTQRHDRATPRRRRAGVSTGNDGPTGDPLLQTEADTLSG